jgi:hypothetical protein
VTGTEFLRELGFPPECVQVRLTQTHDHLTFQHLGSVSIGNIIGGDQLFEPIYFSAQLKRSRVSLEKLCAYLCKLQIGEPSATRFNDIVFGLEDLNGLIGSLSLVSQLL